MPSVVDSTLPESEGISQKLVHLCNLGGNAEINGSISNFYDEAAHDIGIDLYLVSMFFWADAAS
jgi:hypothetical protein